MYHPMKTRKTCATKEDNGGTHDSNCDSSEPSMLDIMRELHNMQTKNDCAKTQLNACLEDIGTQLTAHIQASEKITSETNEKIEKLSEQIEKDSLEKRALIVELDKSKMKCAMLEAKFEKLEKRVESLDEERRKRNIIIEGIPESDTRQVKTSIDELFQVLGLSFMTGDTENDIGWAPNKQLVNPEVLWLF